MNSFQVSDYAPADAVQWDAFIAGCPMAVFLHSRRFLSYHGEKFRDRSLLFWKNKKLCGVFPAAESGGAVASHPGATFGGIIHSGALGGEDMQHALAAAAAHYRRAGFDSLLYKAVPACYRRRPCDDDIYALHHAGAKLESCKLSSVVDLNARGPVSTRRRRGIKKAAGLEVVCGEKHAPVIWELLKENLSRRHGVKPAHTLDEVLHLAELFPDNIKFYSGVLSEKNGVRRCPVYFRFRLACAIHCFQRRRARNLRAGFFI